MTAVATKNTNLFIVISVVKKDKRERLFKHIDDPKNAKGLVDYSPSKRVITLDLFTKALRLILRVFLCLSEEIITSNK